MLGLALIAGLGLVVNLTFGGGVGYWAAAALTGLVLLLWVVVPLRMRREPID